MGKTKSRTTDNDIKLALINQVSSGFKWTVACLLLGWLAWVAKGALVAMAADSNKPAWERVATTAITAIVTLLAPSGLFYTLFKLGVPLIRRRLARIAQLERLLDPGRTSSEPMEEEPSPPEPKRLEPPSP